jgi:glycosyltransferase involved in cell wall biosynthesis
MTDPLGQSQVLPYLKGLAEKGYAITLLSCEKPERKGDQSEIAAFCRQNKISWHPIPYTRKPPVIATLKDVWRLKKTAGSLHRQTPFDVVHCRSYIAALAGQWMKNKYGVAFIFDMRGFWADERVDGGLWHLRNPLYRRVYRYFKQKEKQFLAEADAIVSLTFAGKEEIERRQVARASVAVIPCCVDTLLFDPNQISQPRQQALRSKAGLPEGKCILGYVGSLGTWYLQSEMTAFFKVWLHTHPDSILFFVTTELPALIYAEAQKQSIPTEKIRIVSAHREEVPYYISLMSFGLFFIKQAFSKKASSPVKQGELMAMGVPVICNAGVGDSDFIIAQYQSGVLVHELNEAGYADAISRLPAVAAAADIRQGCLDYFDLAKGIEAYAALYQSLA